jgi:hypothetical protein
LLKKLQFELQYVQQLAIIRWHSLSTSRGDRTPYTFLPALLMIPSPGFAICSIKIRIDYLASGLGVQEGTTNLVEKKLTRVRWPFTFRRRLLPRK